MSASVARGLAVWRPGRKRGIPARKRHGFVAHVREYVWPSMGLVAFGRYVWLKLVRQSGQPHFVALGLAVGIVVAFFPILGTHTVLIVVLCALLRASFLAAMAGSMIANPWTVGPMWAVSYHLGRKILGMGPGNAQAVQHLNELGWSGLWMRLEDLMLHVIVPTIVGGWVMGVPLALLAYGLVYWRLRKRRGKGLI